MLINQFPFAVAPLEAIRFAHDEALCIASLQHDVHVLNRAHKAMLPFTTMSVSRMSTLHD